MIKTLAEAHGAGIERPERGDAGSEAARRAWPRAGMAVALALLIAAFVADYRTGSEISSSLFYVTAVAVAAWFVGRAAGLSLAVLSTTAWAIAFFLVGTPFSRPGVFYWNLTVELGTYLTTAVAVARARAGLEQERLFAARLDRANRELDRETRAVGELQRRLLPPAPRAARGYRWLHHYATSTRAGGDYYDFFPLDGERIGILVGDASGHGAPAAVLMAMTRVLLHTATEELSPPARVLADLGRQLSRALPEGWFVTACYAVLDPASGRLDYSLAGHDPPLVVRAPDGAVERLPARGGLPLGPFPRHPFEAGATALRPGDTLVLYTDGLSEAMSPDGDLFGVERLRCALEGAQLLALEQIRDRLLARLGQHTAGAPLADDLTLLLLRREQGAASETAHARPTVAETRPAD